MTTARRLGELWTATVGYLGCHPLLRRFLGTLAIGLTIESLLLGLHSAGKLGKIEDIGADLFMRVYRHIVLKPEAAVPFVYVDVDEETYRDWAEPVLLPREKLALLIEALLTAEPAVVILDVDLAYPGGSGDDILEEVLSRHAAENEAGVMASAKRVPVVLVRSFRSARHDPETIHPRPRHTRFDDIVSYSSNLHWASIRVSTTEDMVIRHWPLWEPACDGDQLVLVPSVQLATVALLDERTKLTMVEQELAKLPRGTCAEPMTVSQPPVLTFGDVEVDLVHPLTDNRILFTIPWRVPEGEVRPSVPHGHMRVPLLTQIPARNLLNQARSLDPTALHGRIVVIGGSYLEGRDIHMTPIGPMPGALILINALHTALQHGALKPPGTLAKLLFAAGLVVAVCLLFVFFRIGTATILSVLLVLTATLVVGYLWLETGIWVDATISTLAVVLHRWAASLEYGWKHRHPSPTATLSDHVGGERHDQPVASRSSSLDA